MLERNGSFSDTENSLITNILASPSSKSSAQEQAKVTSKAQLRQVLEKYGPKGEREDSCKPSTVAVSLKASPKKNFSFPLASTPVFFNRTYTLSNFQIIRQIGRGHHGEVLQALDSASQQLVALKVIKKTSGSNPFEEFQNEIQIQGHIQHPNVIQLCGYFEEKEKLYIVQECATQGSLFDKIQKYGCLSERVVSKYIKVLSEVLKHLHSHSIIHRDIKPENIVISKSGEIKLTDFGWATLSTPSRSNQLCGTLDYLSPEILQHKEHDHRVDIWSLGVLCFELLYGIPPFYEEDYLATCERIQESKFSFPATQDISKAAKDFISSILVKEPCSRLTLEEIQKHKFLQDCS